MLKCSIFINGSYEMKTINRKLKLIFPSLLFTIFIIFFTKSCVGINPALQTGKIPQDFVTAKHLVFIGLDGWGGVYVPKANMPTVKRMMSRGAWSLDAQSVMPSSSWPNWSSIFYGAPPEQRNTENFPSIFTLIKSNKQTAKQVLFYEWTDLQKICSNETAEKREISSNIKSAKKIAAYITEQKPFFTAVVFDAPDHAGHSKGWGSKEYYDKLKEMDGLIAIIEQAVKSAGIYDDTVFVLSADHGGSDFVHGLDNPAHRKIPAVFYGNGIKKGFRILSPINIYDITPTMAVLMGMDIPPEWTGRVLYEIFK
jgi:predicted AlkP superfamily pyrophosphatase or phosphodiesterase